jgi:dienelactone hydrolase
MSGGFRRLRVAVIAACIFAPAAHGASTTVYFPSADGKTQLVGYVFAPSTPGPHPAVVMLHGRSGPYSSKVSTGCTWVRAAEPSACKASTQAARARMWGEHWAERGVLALHVDSFGPRGLGHGFGRGTHGESEREEVDERTVRPLDAEAALAYLRTRRDVLAGRIAVQGWSNGASTALNVMYRQATSAAPAQGFRFGLAFYPGCGPKALLSSHYRAGAPTAVFLGSDDEEVSPQTCRKVLAGAPAGKGTVEILWYDGATHDFDDPGKSRQSVAANRAARHDATLQVDAVAAKAFER